VDLKGPDLTGTKDIKGPEPRQGNKIQPLALLQLSFMIIKGTSQHPQLQ
jgi:hypothetical protein